MREGEQHDSQGRGAVAETEHHTNVPTITELRVEHARDALGIGTPCPRLSWMVATASKDWRQAGYELEITWPDGKVRDTTDLVRSGDSVFVAWPFRPLVSRERSAIRVRVWGIDGQVSPWSEALHFEIGLLSPDDWTAQFVAPSWEEDTSQPQACPVLRSEFEVYPGFVEARLYVTALGVYEAQLNGAVVGDHVLAPGWTSYSHRLRYQTFDVTAYLRQGANALGVILGDGWYRGRLGFGGGRRNIYGNRLAVLAQLEMTYSDGRTERFVSDKGWRAATGPILASDLYDGETYDARLEHPDWSSAGYRDQDWGAVQILERDLSVLVAPTGPPVRRTEYLQPKTIGMSPSGRRILDFGQNVVGRIRLTVTGQAGQTVTLRHAEVLEDGELCVRPLRTARAIDRYTLRGDDRETWEPRFTFHGFRYVDVEGWPGDMQTADVLAVVCHSSMERTGWFECSDPLVNRLHENVVWSMRGNFLDVPTDCPQRDERLGWTGDVQVFSPAAAYLFDVSGFLSSWLADLAAEQRAAGGAVPNYVPDVMNGAFPVGAAAWGDAAVIVPWVLYQRYGDTGILASQFASMQSWVDWVAARAGKKYLWDDGFQFGDWLDPTAPPDDPGAGSTDPYLVATAYFARSAELLGRSADVLGRAHDAHRYSALAQRVRKAFAREYETATGRMVCDSPTAYALALQFGLLQGEKQRLYAGRRLAELVRQDDYTINTGYVGTPLICDALCSVGEYDAAFRLLMQRRCPSWLYPVTMGATTIWERWDSLLPNGSVNPGEMTSFNHYALGAVAQWLHETLGGLRCAEPGYRHLTIQPHPGGGLTYAHARHRTPYGMAECRWQIRGERIEVTVVVPPNATASVELPWRDTSVAEVGSGSHQWSYLLPAGQLLREPFVDESPKPVIENVEERDPSPRVPLS